METFMNFILFGMALIVFIFAILATVWFGFQLYDEIRDRFF